MANASLDYLKDKGVTNRDIIGMSNLVRIFIDNKLLSNYDDTKAVRDNPWHFFIEDVVEIKDLKIEIKNLITKRDNLTSTLKVGSDVPKIIRDLVSEVPSKSIPTSNKLDNQTN